MLEKRTVQIWFHFFMILFLALLNVRIYWRAARLPMSYLSICWGFNVRVAFLTNDVIDVVQSVWRNARKGSATVWGEIAVGTPRVTKISWALNDHRSRSEGLKKRSLKSVTQSLHLSVMFGLNKFSLIFAFFIVCYCMLSLCLPAPLELSFHLQPLPHSSTWFFPPQPDCFCSTTELPAASLGLSSWFGLSRAPLPGSPCLLSLITKCARGCGDSQLPRLALSSLSSCTILKALSLFGFKVPFSLVLNHHLPASCLLPAEPSVQLVLFCCNWVPRWMH